jgi:hypothetical protein
MLAKQLHMYCGSRKIDWLDFATAIETLIAAVYTVGQYTQELGILLPAWKPVTYRARYHLLNSGRFYSTESKEELSLLLDEMRDKLCKYLGHTTLLMLGCVVEASSPPIWSQY